MDQLARLGVIFDQEGADPLIKNLQKVATTSKAAETATENLTDATKKGGAAAKNYSLGVDQMNAHLVAYKNHLKAVKVANDNAVKSQRALGAASLNLGRQFSDVGVSLAGGINPLMVLIQQGPQIADGFAVASAAGLSFKGVIVGIYAQLAPLVATFAPLVAGIAAVSGAVFVLVDAHNKQDKAIKDLNKDLAEQDKALRDLSPWIFKTGTNADLAADGQRNFDNWLRTANVSIADQTRLLRENTLRMIENTRGKAADKLFTAQMKAAEVSKPGPRMMAGGMGSFSAMSAAPATDPTNNPFYKEAAANERKAKDAYDAINAYYNKMRDAPESAFGSPKSGGGSGRGRTGGGSNDNSRGLRGVAGLGVDPSSVVDLGKNGPLNKYSPGGDRTIGGDPMLTSAEDASKQLQAILDKRAQDRVETEKGMWSGLIALSSSGNKKLAAIGKAAAIAQATIDGVLAVQKALSAFPPPFNVVAAAAVGALAAVNVAKIAGVKGFEEGGYTGGGGQKQVAGVVHGQEFVVNAAGTRRNRAALEAMNAGRAVPRNPANNNARGSGAVYAPSYSLGSGNLITETVYRDFNARIAQSQAETLRMAPMAVAKHQGQKR